MKKGKSVLLWICAAWLFLTLGIFIGRNQKEKYLMIPDGALVQDVLIKETTDGLLDINAATKAQLMALPGIGEVLADRIISYREEAGRFNSVEDLLNVPGIGDKKLEEIVYLIKTGG